MTTSPVQQERPPRRLSGRGLAVFAVALLAVAVAAVVGVRGLLSSPIQSVGADGTAVLHGTWEPYSCSALACEGYVQAGARSVFVVLHPGCPQPRRAADITVEARPDTTLGTASYRAVRCSA